jgi:hypothetical protein
MPLDGATIYGEAAATLGQHNYTFINDSGYTLRVDLYIINVGTMQYLTSLTLPPGAREIKPYQWGSFIVEFSGGNATLAITGSTARFTSTGGGGI